MAGLPSQLSSLLHRFGRLRNTLRDRLRVRGKNISIWGEEEGTAVIIHLNAPPGVPLWCILRRARKHFGPPSRRQGVDLSQLSVESVTCGYNSSTTYRHWSVTYYSRTYRAPGREVAKGATVDG